MRRNNNLFSWKSIPSSIKEILLPRRRLDFITFFKNYLDSYSKKDKRVMKQAYDRYLLFCSKNPSNCNLRTPDEDTVRQFAEFLIQNSKGTGAGSTFSRFKKAVIQATKQGIFKTNPCSGVKCTRRSDDLIKDILSEDEILMLTQTGYGNESPEIRRAFIFSLYTGIRFCDLKKLTYANIDYANRLVSFVQDKTKGSSSRCVAYIPLRDDIIELTSNPTNPKPDKSDLIFNLPSHPTCLKHLKAWTAAAGINKHITWHCARHSFATNILKNGADIKVVADLLGHSGLKYVEKYTRAMDKMKVKAVNSLPPISKSFVLGAEI